MKRISRFDPWLWKIKFYSGWRLWCDACAQQVSGLEPNVYESWALAHGLEPEFWMGDKLEIVDVRRAYGERCLYVFPSMISPYWTAVIPVRIAAAGPLLNWATMRKGRPWMVKKLKWRIHHDRLADLPPDLT